MADSSDLVNVHRVSNEGHVVRSGLLEIKYEPLDAAVFFAVQRAEPLITVMRRSGVLPFVKYRQVRTRFP